MRSFELQKHHPCVRPLSRAFSLRRTKAVRRGTLWHQPMPIPCRLGTKPTEESSAEQTQWPGLAPVSSAPAGSGAVEEACAAASPCWLEEEDKVDGLHCPGRCFLLLWLAATCSRPLLYLSGEPELEQNLISAGKLNWASVDIRISTSHNDS